MIYSHSKFDTNILGMDEILRHQGIKLNIEDGNGLVILLRGKPGTGKTTLAIQMALASLEWKIQRNEAPTKGRTYYYSLEQISSEIKNKIEEIVDNSKQDSGTSLESLSDCIISEKDEIVIYGADDISQDDNYEKPVCNDYILDRVLSLANSLKNSPKSTEDKHKFVVVDGLNTLGRQDRNNINLYELVMIIKKISIVSMIIYEPLENEDENLDNLSDMIIEMYGEQIKGAAEHLIYKISILKSRYQSCLHGSHQYKFFPGGIRIFPSPSAILRKNSDLNSSNKINQYKTSMVPMGDVEQGSDGGYYSGIHNNGEEILSESLIVRMLGKVKYGSFTVIFGPRRTSKSLLSMDFLRAGARKNHNGMLLSFIDNSDTIIKEKKCLYNVKCDSKEKQGENCTNCFNKRVFLYHWRSEGIMPSEFFYYLKKRLSDNKSEIKRLALWDLTQLDFRFPFLANDRMFLPTFIELTKNLNVSTLVMGSGKTLLTNAASAMADNVIFCWRDRLVENKREVISIYVDRVEGEIDPKSKKLYAFDLESGIDLGREIKGYSVEDIDSLVDAKDEIRKIQNLQGLPD